MVNQTNKKYKLQSLRIEKQALSVFSELAVEFCRLKGEGPDKSNTQSRIIALMRQEHRNIKVLWESFTTNRDRLSEYLRDPAKSTAAYLLGFHLPNMIRTMKTWQRLEERGNLQEIFQDQSFEGKVQIIDLGCGTGAIAQATALTLREFGFHKDRIKAIGYDRNGRFLDAFRYGFRDILPSANVSASKLDFIKFSPAKLQIEKDDLTILTLGYTWNEMVHNKAIAKKMLSLIQKVLTSTRGLLFLLEPANQTPARQVMELRDTLTSAGQILYPCQGSFSCPMLLKNKDWCYSEFDWKPPRTITFLDKRLGIDRHRLKTSALIASSQHLSQTYGSSSHKSTVVGRPLNKLGKPELLLCNEKGLNKIKIKGPKTPKKGETIASPS